MVLHAVFSSLYAIMHSVHQTSFVLINMEQDIRLENMISNVVLHALFLFGVMVQSLYEAWENRFYYVGSHFVQS